MFADDARKPLLIALALENKLADRKSAFKRLNGNNRATSCTNLVSIRSIILEFMLLKRAIFAAIRPQFYDKSSSSLWRSEMDWKIVTLISQ